MGGLDQAPHVAAVETRRDLHDARAVAGHDHLEVEDAVPVAESLDDTLDETIGCRDGVGRHVHRRDEVARGQADGRRRNARGAPTGP